MILLKKYRINVQGMTCTGCEEHIAMALENIGAKNIEASFRRGEAVFELPEEVNIETARRAIDEAKYQPGDVEEVKQQEKVILGDEGDYDLLTF